MSKESVNEGLAAGIECGGDYLSVAVASYRSAGLSVEFKLIDCVTEHRGHRHADVVLGELSGLLATHDLASEDINMVASGRGPGGFTGVRVGLATAQGLAMGWNVPFWGVCSLETLALNDCEAPGVVAAMIDARRGQIYSALFGVDRLGTRICLAEPVVDDPQSVATRYEDLRQGAPIRFLGSGALAYGFADDADARRHQPSAGSTVALALEQWSAAGFPPSGMSVDPIYLRPSDAEIDYERRHGKKSDGA